MGLWRELSHGQRSGHLEEVSSRLAVVLPGSPWAGPSIHAEVRGRNETARDRRPRGRAGVTSSGVGEALRLQALSSCRGVFPASRRGESGSAAPPAPRARESCPGPRVCAAPRARESCPGPMGTCSGRGPLPAAAEQPLQVPRD